MRNREITRQQTHKVRQSPRDALQRLFEKLVPVPKVWRAARRTPYAPEATFWMFLGQTFSGDKSCTEAVVKRAAQYAGPAPSPDTGAYCKARKRLRQEDLETIDDAVIEAGHRTQEQAGRWWGRRVRVVDGSTVSMPDTPENQALYPQPGRQQPGCGFPMMRLVALFSLATGGILGCARGALKTSERALFRTLWWMLETGDVVLADRGFCSYAECYLLQTRGVDYVMRKHAKRTVGVVRRKRLGRNDYLVEWIRTNVRPHWLTDDEWTGMPKRLTLREITVCVDIPGFRTTVIAIATSLCDPKAFPTRAFADLYRRRWMAELFLRDIKTSQGMDILRCKTPEKIHKELLLHLIAYNLLRATLLQAARRHRKLLHRLSFKTALAAVRNWLPSPHDQSASCAIPQKLLLYLANAQVPLRPNRIEPRAIKRRPKEYDRLNQPRNVLRQRLLTHAV